MRGNRSSCHVVTLFSVPNLGIVGFLDEIDRINVNSWGHRFWGPRITNWNWQIFEDRTPSSLGA